MKKTLFFGFFLILLQIATALPTDGNYTLIAHSFEASGKTMWDGNIAMFASIGEPATSKNTVDANKAMATGFYGWPISLPGIITTVTTAIATQTKYIVLMTIANSNLSFLIGGIVVIVLFFGFIKYKKHKEE